MFNKIDKKINIPKKQSGTAVKQKEREREGESSKERERLPS